MEIEVVKCECCGLKEECTQHYITQVKSKFDGKWLCGLCSEAVRDEINIQPSSSSSSMDDAVKAHMSFCANYKSNPAFRVADGMKQMLRRRSRELSTSSSSSKSASKNKFTKSASMNHPSSTFSLY